MSQLRTMRFTVRVVDSTAKLDELLNEFDARLAQQSANDAAMQEAKREAKREFIRRQRKSEAVRRDMDRLMEKFSDEI